MKILADFNEAANQYNIGNNKRLRELCSGLLLHSPIKVFGYRRFFFDGTYLALCTDIHYQEYYFKNFINVGRVFYHALSNSNLKKFSYFLWPAVPNTRDPIMAALLKHDIWNGMTIYWRTNKYIESFAFAANASDTNLQNYLINHLDLLKNFIFEFWRKGKLVICDYDKASLARFKDFEEFKFSQMLEEIPDDKIPLTIRQEECIRMVAKGYTSKKIAKELEIAPKTVENHILAVKEKALVRNKDEIVDLYYSGRFLIT